MPFRDSESNRYAGPVRWRRGDIFDADDRVAVLALTGVEEISLEEAGQVFVDEPTRRPRQRAADAPQELAADGD